MIRSVQGSDKVPQENSGGVAGTPVSVLVVGAGPTGLLLASELERRGVRCHLIDARPGPLHWDRATVVHPRSLQIFESLGLAGKFLEAGCRQRVIKIHSRGKLLGTMDLSTCGSVYGFNLGVSEEVTERILTEYLETQGGKVNRSSRLTGLEPHAGGVLAEIERDGVPYHVDAQWVVGCDGLHSPTRELSGIGFEGHDIAKPWAVFDATVQGWTDTYEGTFVYLDSLPVILTALPGQRWRVYLRPSSEKSDLVADAASTLRAYLPAASFVDVENPTRFHCHTKVAGKYRAGRVFLAGDAAHLCSPSEGHGMNCGLQDAFNLAWKLALVQQGAAEPGLLDSYEIERRPIAERVMQSGDGFEHALTVSDSAECDERDQSIRAKLGDARTLHHEVAAETELIADYCESPIVFGDANSKLAAGRRLPDTIPVRLAGAQPHKLHGLGHRAGHTLLLLAGPGADIPRLADLHGALQKLTAESTLFEAAVALGSDKDLPAPIGKFEASAADLIGVEGITLLAVRPDGYIGLRADRDHSNALERYGALIGAGRNSSPMGSSAAGSA
jgi:2-polyprenyl-6-methoxyphenol hydroxylase-like FAD-dependent oxidoreductase